MSFFKTMFSSTVAEIQKSVVSKIVGAVVGTATLVTAGVTLSALKSSKDESAKAESATAPVAKPQTTLLASASMQSPGSAPPATASAPAAPPATGGAAAPGGIVPEYQADYGGAEASATADAVDQAQNFLNSKGWTEGRNPNGMWVVVGKASLPCGADSKDFDQCRRQAAAEAMFSAKKAMVKYLADEVSTQMSSRYAEGDVLKQLAQQRQASIVAEPTLMDKVIALADGVVSQELKNRGIDVGPSAENKAWSDEERNKAEELARKEATELVSKSEFSSAVQSIAQCEVSGMQAYRTFEYIPAGKKGSIAVIAIYSAKSGELQRAYLGLGQMPTGSPKEPVGKWAQSQGADALLYTFGTQPRTNENGEVVLVAFGQSTPIKDSERSMDAAEEKAALNASAEARRFFGELVMSQENQVEASTLKEFAESADVFSSQASYEKAINATAQKLTMPAGSTVYRWKLKHPLSQKTTAGVVMVYSVSEALQANALRDKLNAAAGSKGGRGIADKRPPAASSSAAAPPRPKTGSGTGAGAAGEDP
jgi:hypothetical protein